jgi:muramoyltetrapeptide carboxypeptidase
VDLGLKGRAAAVAAASRGLGRAVSRALAAEGASVAMCGRDQGRIREAAEWVARETGARTLPVVADVGVAEDCRRFVDQAAAAFGRLDVLVTNTGGPRPGGFEAVGDEDWEAAFRVTLANVVHLVRAAVPHMRANRWGRVVNVASISAKQPVDGLVLSNAFRPAIAGLAKTLANELGRDGILINTVCPGCPRAGRRHHARAVPGGPGARGAPGPDRRGRRVRGRGRVPVLGARLLRDRRRDPGGRRRGPGPALSALRPRALRAGDLVGVCAPAGPVDAERLDRGVAELGALGFDVRLAAGVRARGPGFTAGTPADRLRDLRGLLEDDEVAAVFCARGGAGSGWLLRGLDPEAIRARPKLLVGYSDVTFLHLLWDRLGLATLHGPMVAWELASGAYDRDSLRWALSGEGAPYATGPDDLLPLRAGEAEGVVRGGCLSILAAAAGTPWALAPADDTILFLEDLDEPPYRIDRLLLQLRESGALTNVKGIVFGDMKGCSPPVAADYDLTDVIRRALDGLEVPVALGLSSGHTSNPLVSLPFGVRARLRCGEEDAGFEYLEAGVS